MSYRVGQFWVPREATIATREILRVWSVPHFGWGDEHLIRYRTSNDGRLLPRVSQCTEYSFNEWKWRRGAALRTANGKQGAQERPAGEPKQ